MNARYTPPAKIDVGNHECLSEDWMNDNLPDGWIYDCAFNPTGFTITATDGSTLFLPLRLLAPPHLKSAE